MKKLTSSKELTSEQKMLKEVKDLLLLDGWKEITDDFDNKFALVFTVYGEIVHRYITWDSEYSEWHGCSFHYPAFWLTNKCFWHEDIDDCTIGLVASFDVPLRTQNTIKALKIMEDLQYENERIYSMKMINIQKGDMFIDEQFGIGQPTIIVCSNVSKSWFRRKKPFAFIRTFDKGRVERNKSPMWFSEKDVEDLFYVAKNSEHISYVPVDKE